MGVDKLLELEEVGILLLEFFRDLWVNLFDSSKHIVAHVLIPVLLEHHSWQLLELELHCVNEVTEVSACASLRPMVVLAWDRPVVRHFDLLLRLLLN